MVATGQEMVREKKFSRSGELSGNFTLSQGKFKSLKEIKEKWHFTSTYLYFSLYFYCFLTCEIFFCEHESCCSVVHCGLLLLLIYRF